MAAIVALVLLLSIPATTLGWGYTGHMWTSRNLLVCQDQKFPYSSMWNTVKNGIGEWNGQQGFSISFSDNVVLGCDIKIEYKAMGSTNVMSTTTYYASPVWYDFDDVQIWFNSSRGSHIWWYGATQNCNVLSLSSVWLGGSDCKADGRSIAAHEMGHALGLSENTTNYATHCTAGYYFTNSLQACDYYGEAQMYWNSDDGYRRALQSDDINGLAALY